MNGGQLATLLVAALLAILQGGVFFVLNTIDNRLTRMEVKMGKVAEVQAGNVERLKALEGAR